MTEPPHTAIHPDLPAGSARAALSLTLGIAAVTLIPVLTALVAPCGFPVAMLSGISAVLLGRRSKKENPGSPGVSTAGIVTGWVGIVANTLIMLVKLAMFVIIWVLPILAIWLGVKKH
jgi:hypothetical protein